MLAAWVYCLGLYPFKDTTLQLQVMVVLKSQNKQLPRLKG